MDAGTKAQEALSSLRELLATRSTRDVAGVLLEMCMRRANDLDFQGELMSPARQGDVLLTQLLSTTEPTDPRPFEATDWSRTIDLLNEAFGVYMELFWPDAEELPNLSEEWKHVREVAMPAFLHYFNTGLIANPEQVRTRIASYLIPFDRAFANAGLLSATDALRIADWVGARLQRALDSLNAVMDEVQKARDLAMKRVSSLEAARKLVQEKFPGLGDRLTRALDEYGTVSKSELVTEFGQLGESYWVQFSIGRGEAQALTYPTEAAAVSKRPLIRLHDDRAMVPSVNSVWTAIVESGEELLSQPATRDRYFSHRDQMLEVEAAREIKRILSPGAQVIEGSFEYSDSRGEHDVIVVDGDTALIVEAKASPPPEPFRDPEKAFTRLHRAFRADRGIQKGFEQAESIRSRLERGDVVVLYDRRGKEVATLDPTTIKHRFSVVVTRDDFGALATDLALLLEKPGTAPYPWVVNILDLSAIADAWQHLGWGTAQLRAYLESRVRLHGKAFASDELEIVGYYLQHGSLETLVSAAADRVSLVQSYSDFFDQLYMHQTYGTPAPMAQATPPVTMDLRASLMAGEPVFVDTAGNVISRKEADSGNPRRMKAPGRNRPCPCGSGKKFKRCCGLAS